MARKDLNVVETKKIKKFSETIIAILSFVAVSIFPVLFLYFQNADEASFSEVIDPLVTFSGIGIIFFLFFLIISKSLSKAAIIADLFLLVSLNYALLEKGIQVIFPGLRYWHVILLGLFVLTHMAWFICRMVPDELAQTISLVICIVFCGLILINGVFAIPTIVNKAGMENKMIDQQESNVEVDSSMPNVYYLLFDEYSSIDFMKKYYDYDNSEFAEYLLERGFNLSYNSQNESIMTSTITTNYVNLDYVVTNYTSESEKEYLRHNNLLFKFLKENNYKITGIGNSDYFGIQSEGDHLDSSAKTAEGDTLKTILINNTIAYPFFERNYSANAKFILDSVERLKSLKHEPSSSQFTLLYIAPSHTPFAFDENGEMLRTGFTNWEDKRYYLGTYKYTTKLMIEIVDSILKTDPNSIIVLQSDHSARASTDANLFMKMFDLKDMANPFNAVYYCGKPMDISGLSGVNTWRVIVNELFDKNYSLVEVPIDEYKYK